MTGVFSFQGMTGTTTTQVTYEPPWIDMTAGLALGGSYTHTESGTSTVTTNFPGLPGEERRMDTSQSCRTFALVFPMRDAFNEKLCSRGDGRSCGVDNQLDPHLGRLPQPLDEFFGRQRDRNTNEEQTHRFAKPSIVRSNGECRADA